MTATPDNAAPPAVPSLDEGLWLSISEIARIKNVARQTIAEHVERLEADGLIETRPGKGKAKLVNLAQYNLARNETGDVAKEAGHESRDAADDDADDAPRDAGFRQAAAREKRYAADLKEIEVRKQLRELVEVATLADDTARLGEAIVQVIDRLPLRADEMAAAVGREGAGGARAQYKRDARDLRAAIVAALQKFVEGVTAAPAEPVILAVSDAPLWGDLDPADRDAQI